LICCVGVAYAKFAAACVAHGSHRLACACTNYLRTGLLQLSVPL